MFVDALGWKLVQERQFLKDLLPNQQACQTLFGYSSTCDPTILTGTLPEEHGHFSCFIKANDERPFDSLKYLGWLPNKVAGHHRIRGKVSQYLARAKGYTGYFQIYSVDFNKIPFLDYTEKKDIYEPGGILGGQENIFSHWKRSGKKWMRSDWRKGDAFNVEEAKAAIAKGNVELIYLFTARLDAIMHKHGTSGQAVDQAFASFESDVRELAQLAESKYDDFRIYLFSDHGMANTREASDLMLRWEALNFQYGIDYTAVWDSTMVRFWFHQDSVRARALDWLHEQSEGRVLSDVELSNWGCVFPDYKYGEVFYLLKPGILFVPSFMNQKWVAGMHGYDPAHEDSTACWLTNHPTAKADRLTDIFNVMLEASKEKNYGETKSLLRNRAS